MSRHLEGWPGTSTATGVGAAQPGFCRTFTRPLFPEDTVTVPDAQVAYPLHQAGRVDGRGSARWQRAGHRGIRGKPAEGGV